MIPQAQLETPAGPRRFTDLPAILGADLPRLPHVLRLLAENHLRETGESGPLVQALQDWLNGRAGDFEFSFRPNRLLMHDTTCTPALADIAGLRDAVALEFWNAGGSGSVAVPPGCSAAWSA